MKEVTLKQIAENLGISVTTVSKALKNYPDVSKKTKALVKEEAKKLHYKPNVFAVNLRTKESKTVGLIIPEVVHHFFSSVINGIIEEAERKGYLVIILQSNESYQLEKKQVDLLISKRVDGIMISLANDTVDISHLLEIKEHEIPLVMFDKISKLVPCSKIIINDRQAAYDATKFLIDSGCKKIAHFRGALLPQNSIDRFLGYKKALEDHGLTYDSSLIYMCERVDYEDGRRAALQLMKDNKEVDGIFAVTDMAAVGAMTVFKEHGIKVPEDISVMGFSNWFLSQAITPSLSTIDQPGYEMGRKTFKLLRKEMKAKKAGLAFEPQTKILETSVIKRDSTK
ncbi:MAG TPA: LacI family DNA-binding transcriptional regulator [Flavobacteriaceae bacterium]|nr:LacI family DNA-binding transcriptional regulator [Flavobacteriaceae bacterium]MCB9213932.1 LacI family DNA-binding transcriptional regulator [Alteromonas sp.]HPF11083.1 LacI family DNA-binding transcriptional regulator [Flavobacteriaceae bacterium]HQU21249.1 LacI family DNA-binding transcriptional regulator [Flavobacteriaceae bacterium]HQU64310.1 LacI family DNA-binding transcriptional regulator [Flavobacteriaceae bacterium]